MSSLDPRINRLGLLETTHAFDYSSFEGIPYEMFWVAKPGKPYEHVGIVHAMDNELALIYAKEQYSRRGGNCYGLMSVSSEAIWATKVEDDVNAFDVSETFPWERFVGAETLVFGLKRRGKHHTLLGALQGDAVETIQQQLAALRVAPCVNLWLVAAKETAILEAGEEGIWNTLQEKQYRDAVFYKSADKIKAFIESRA